VFQEVDVVTTAPIPAFCSSDEEDEERDALLYLPIAPEIEDPEDNWVPVSTILVDFAVCNVT
jgi:COMPASS component SWD1